MNLDEQLEGWIPIRVYWQGGAPFVDWCYLGERRLTAPFFDQTVQECMRRPFNLLFRHQTPIDALGARADGPATIAPTGFIFHTSRCGSTLISQMLAASPQNVVISEARSIDAVMRAHFRAPGVTDEVRARWLRWMVGALGRRRTPGERRLFIKFDCWSVLDLPLVERAFPGVPWVFLYREPIEVLVSQLRRRGAHMIPGVLEPALLGFEPASLVQMTAEEYCARVLARICEAALRGYRPGRALLVNYRQLPEAVCTSVAEHFRADFDDDERELMLRAAQFDAKNPSLDFVDDTQQKRREASDAARAAAERWVAPLYERLEALRTSAP